MNNEKFKNEQGGNSIVNTVDILRAELYILLKNHDLNDYEVLLKSKELNDEINKEMRKQINIDINMKAFVDKDVIWVQSKNYVIAYKDYKMFSGLIVKNGNVFWFKIADKIFSTLKETFNYLMLELEHNEENYLNYYF